PLHSMTLPDSYAPPPESFGRAAKPAFPWAIALGGLTLAILAVLFVAAAARPSAPVKTPTVSAQERTTSFLNGFFTFMTRPEFYDENRRELLLDDLVGRYIVPSERLFFNTGFNLAFNSASSPAEQQQFVQYVQRIYVANAAYTVESESPTEIELTVRSGEIWILLRDGTSTYVPLADAFKGAELTNIDGEWYISGIDS
ncbi:MAG TPA: hypothetical protein VGE07_23320, partial [Herpetosiphonaceae bacterium]